MIKFALIAILIEKSDNYQIILPIQKNIFQSWV